ncbi:MAG: glycosyltransferase [Clostridia bacterium]|nr:glycosyltransferase [Clostridia bacterium]
MDKKPTRVLQIIADFKKGGVQADVMYPVRILSEDEVYTDVMLLSDTIGFYEEEFSKKGNIYRIPIKRKKSRIQRALSIVTNYFYVRREMNKFFAEHGDYDAVHARHLILNAPCISAAKKAGIPVRIAHCHVNKPKRKDFRDRLYVRLYLWVCAQVLKRCATHRFGVTEFAVEYMFGKGKGIVIKNPTVDLEKFDYRKYPTVDKSGIHLIMVGSYSSRKNQRFALEVFRELYRKCPDSSITFIGYPRTADDDYLPNLKKYVEENGLEDKVSFLPQDSNVAEALSKSTIMLIPSLQEGLPNVALEAQAMGVSCFVSTDVSRNCNCGICEFLPLTDGAEKWADAILEYTNIHGVAKQYIDMTAWDNRKVCKEHLDYWRGKPMY